MHLTRRGGLLLQFRGPVLTWLCKSHITLLPSDGGRYLKKMEPISIRYKITEPEYMKACSAHWSAQGYGTISNLIWGFLAIAFGIVFLTFIFWLAVFFFICGGILLFLLLIRTFIWRRAFRDTKKFHNDIFVEFKDDSIHSENLEGKSDLNWSFYSWYLDTPDHVLLYMTKRSFSVIPKSAFKDEHSLQAFINTVKSKLKRIR